MAFFSHASKSSAVFLPQFPKSMGMIGQSFAQLPPALEDRLQRGDGQRLPKPSGTGKEEHVAFLTDKGMQVRSLVHVHVAPSPEILVRAVRRSSCLLMTQGALVAKNAHFPVRTSISCAKSGWHRSDCRSEGLRKRTMCTQESFSFPDNSRWRNEQKSTK